jgi:hypothetical protein
MKTKPISEGYIVYYSHLYNIPEIKLRDKEQISGFQGLWLKRNDLAKLYGDGIVLQAVTNVDGLTYEIFFLLYNGMKTAYTQWKLYFTF